MDEEVLNSAIVKIAFGEAQNFDYSTDIGCLTDDIAEEYELNDVERNEIYNAILNGLIEMSKEDGEYYKDEDDSFEFGYSNELDVYWYWDNTGIRWSNDKYDWYNVQVFIKTLESLDSTGLLGYVGQGLANFLAQEPETETTYQIKVWVDETQNIEEALSTSSLTGGDDEKTIKDWISDGDREHFIKEYCPDVNLE
jgi:hypothetical protein